MVFFTNKGTFYGPPFVKMSGEPGMSPRQLITPVLEEITFDFTINNILCYDFEYAQIVRPISDFPIEIFAGEKIQFGLDFPFYIFPGKEKYDI